MGFVMLSNRVPCRKRKREREKEKRKKGCTNRLKSERDRVARGFFRCERRSSRYQAPRFRGNTKHIVTWQIEFIIASPIPCFSKFLPPFFVFIDSSILRENERPESRHVNNSKIFNIFFLPSNFKFHHQTIFSIQSIDIKRTRKIDH